MNDHRRLIADADLELTHESGSRISVHLKSGQGDLELSDARLLRFLIRNSVLNRERRAGLQRLLSNNDDLKAKIDISVGRRRVARLDTAHEGGYFSRFMGLRYLSIRPVAFLMALITSASRTHSG